MPLVGIQPGAWGNPVSTVLAHDSLRWPLEGSSDEHEASSVMNNFARTGRPIPHERSERARGTSSAGSRSVCVNLRTDSRSLLRGPRHSTG